MQGVQCACLLRHAGSATLALVMTMDRRLVTKPAALGSCRRRPGATTGSRCGCRCSLRGACVRPTAPGSRGHGHCGYDIVKSVVVYFLMSVLDTPMLAGICCNQ